MAERKSRSRRQASAAARKTGKARVARRVKRTARVPRRATRKIVRSPKAASRPAAPRKGSRGPGRKAGVAPWRAESARPARTKRPAYDRARRTLREPESGPALTGGDVDANWEEAYHSGSEAPGGDNPTPDQDYRDRGRK